MRRRKQKGQMLIEVIVALSIAVVLLFAIIIVIISSLSNAQFTKNQNLANHYAQQGMEVVRSIWNSDLNTFNSLSGSYCLDKNSTTLVGKDQLVQGCSSGGGKPGTNVDLFAREVDLEKESSECLSSVTPPPSPTPAPLGGTKVTVVVSWSDNKCTSLANLFCHKVELISCFSKIYTLQAP